MGDKIEYRAARGSAASFVNLAVTIAIAVIQVPLILSKWSAEVYGLWSTVMSVASILIVLDAGHQNYIGNELVRYWRLDKSLVKQTLSSACIVALGIGALEVVCGIVFILSRSSVITSIAKTPELEHEANLALIIYLIFWCFAGSLGGILVRAYPAAGLFARSQWLGVASRLTMFLFLALSILNGAGLLGAMVVSVLGGVIFNVYQFYDIRKVFRELLPWLKGYSIRVGICNFRASLVLTTSALVEQAATNGVLVLSALILAPIDIAIFASIRTLTNAFTQGNLVLLSPIIPDLARYHYEQDVNKIVAVFSFGWLAGCTGLSLGVQGLLLIIDPLYQIWTHDELTLNHALFSALLVSVAIRQWNASLLAYIASVNAVKEQMVVSVVRAAFAVCLCLLLVRPYGLPGVGYAILISEFAVTIILVRVTAKNLKAFGGAFPWVSGGLGLSQIGICCSALYLGSYLGLDSVFLVLIHIALTGLVGWLMWRSLPAEAACRVVRLFKKFWQKYRESLDYLLPKYRR